MGGQKFLYFLKIRPRAVFIQVDFDLLPVGFVISDDLAHAIFCVYDFVVLNFGRVNIIPRIFIGGTYYTYSADFVRPRGWVR